MGKYGKLEFRLRVPRAYADPNDPREVDLTLRLTSPSGRQLVLPAFFGQDYERRKLGTGQDRQDWLYPRGEPAWQARFAPSETGRYQAVAVLKNRAGTVASPAVPFECVPSPARGFVQISRRDPRFCEFSEGQPFFMVGQNLAFIGSGQYMTLSRAEDTFRRLAAEGANYLRIWTCGEDWALAIEAPKSAWGRSWSGAGPVVPEPGTNNSGRQCVRVRGAALPVRPTHPVALRPGARYALTGQARVAAGTALRLRIGQQESVVAAAGASQAWLPFRREFPTGPGEYWLTALSFQAAGPDPAWVRDLSLREVGGGPELLWEAEVNRPRRGFYNPVDCFLLDELVTAAGASGIYLQLCLLTRDLYRAALKDPASAEYEQAIADAKKFLRHAVARWGYATSVAAWEYWNEMDPGLPTGRFYTELGEFLETVDIYHHLRTTSTWGPSAGDCRHPQLDLADTHFYLRPDDQPRLRDEVEAVRERTRWLREVAPARPAHLGEFGLANNQWQLTAEMKQSPSLADVKHALWASALSGASGTGLYWWWERLDQRGVYPLYRPLTAFIREVPWTSGEIKNLAIQPSLDHLEAVGLRSQDRAWLWIFNRQAAWHKTVVERQAPAAVAGATIRLDSWPAGSWHIAWWDTATGQVLSETEALATDHGLTLPVPAFVSDLACQVIRR